MSRITQHDPFGELLGYSVNPGAGPGGSPTATLTIDDRHLSPAGVAHGGTLFSLLDFIMGGHVVESLDEEATASTVGMRIEFFRPVRKGAALTASSAFEHRGRSLIRTRGEVHDQDGKIVACAYGTYNVYRRRG